VLIALIASLLAVASAISVMSFMSADKTAPPVEGPVRDGVDLGQRITDYTTRSVAQSGYLPPLPAQRRILAQGVGLYLDGRHSAAARRLAQVDYRVVTYTDTVTGRRFAEVSDRAAEDRRGWGRVYIDLGAPAAWSVQVPHPVADAYSDALGIGILRGTPGGVLVLAGAHRKAGGRDAADVAHRRDSVFHAICAELTARRMPGIQVHGYAYRSAPDHDVIVSTGVGDDARTQAQEMARRLDKADFRVCRAWAEKCRLAGRTNTQGRLAAEQGVPFLHIEMGRNVREDVKRRGQAIAAISAVVADWA
jgi:hypothetical protein